MIYFYRSLLFSVSWTNQLLCLGTQQIFLLIKMLYAMSAHITQHPLFSVMILLHNTSSNCLEWLLDLGRPHKCYITRLDDTLLSNTVNYCKLHFYSVVICICCVICDCQDMTLKCQAFLHLMVQFLTSLDQNGNISLASLETEMEKLLEYIVIFNPPGEENVSFLFHINFPVTSLSRPFKIIA